MMLLLLLVMMMMTVAAVKVITRKLVTFSTFNARTAALGTKWSVVTVAVALVVVNSLVTGVINIIIVVISVVIVVVVVTGVNFATIRTLLTTITPHTIMTTGVFYFFIRRTERQSAAVVGDTQCSMASVPSLARVAIAAAVGWWVGWREKVTRSL